MVASCVKAVIAVIKKVKTKAVRLVKVEIVIADKDFNVQRNAVPLRLMYNGTLFRCVRDVNGTAFRCT